MALGVYVALCDHWKRSGTTGRFKIVGFNNTLEFRTIMAADPYDMLAASVDQSLDAYCAAVFRILDTHISGQDIDSSILIEPGIRVRGNDGSSSGSDVS